MKEALGDVFVSARQYQRQNYCPSKKNIQTVGLSIRAASTLMALGRQAGIPRHAGPKCMGPGVQFVRSTQVGTLVDTCLPCYLVKLVSWTGP